MKILVLLFVALNVLSPTSEEECTLKTKYGILEGKQMTSREGRTFLAFLGIPYAAPPIGRLRFLPPKAPLPWEGTRNATQEGNMCLQKGFFQKMVGSEDCLYLNVYTHSSPSNRSSPVMFFIHGGGFHMGSSSPWMVGPEFLLDKDIVLVTINYRVGPFGFLSTEDEVIPGNMGMKDQVRALRWVKDNIEVFGGDPGRVTIFGSSAGGASVHFLMHSPLSEHLFSKAISQSGTIFSGFALAKEGTCRNITEHLALSLKCPFQSSEDIFLCLQNRSSSEILKAFNDQEDSRYEYNNILLRPVIEKHSEHAFLTKNPRNEYSSKPWLVGVTSNEGIYKISQKTLNETIYLVNTKFQSFGSKVMFLEDEFETPDESANQLYEFYFKNSSTTEDYIRSLEQMVTDSWFIWPTERAIPKHNGSIYYYLYDHQSQYSYAHIFGGTKGHGVSHMDELLMLFSQTIFPELSKEDTNVSNLIVSLWANFATTGNPTPNYISQNPQNNESINFVWEATTSFNPSYLHIETNNLSMKSKLFKKRMDFWRKIY